MTGLSSVPFMVNNYSLPRQMVFDEVTEKYKLPIKKKNVELLINLVRHEQAEKNESSQNAKKR